MKRGQVTYDEMIRRGWDFWSGEKDVTEKLLKAIREGAKVQVQKRPEGEGRVYIREVADEDSCIYYPRYSTEEYTQELVLAFVDNQWQKVMVKDTVVGRYKTRSQRYMGD